MTYLSVVQRWEYSPLIHSRRVWTLSSPGQGSGQWLTSWLCTHRGWNLWPPHLKEPVNQMLVHFNAQNLSLWLNILLSCRHHTDLPLTQLVFCSHRSLMRVSPMTYPLSFHLEFWISTLREVPLEVGNGNSVKSRKIPVQYVWLWLCW